MADFRDEFQTLLESTFIPSVGDRDKIEKDFDAFLNHALNNIPEHLYRYRKYDDYSFDSFRDGTIYLCNANRFSDKYDSRVYVDRKKVLDEQIEAFKSAIADLLKEIRHKNPNIKAESAARICYYIESGLSDKDIIDTIIKEDYANFIGGNADNMKNRELRFRSNEKTAKIGCFTESVQSKFMWDHYAGGYTGFALEYNLKEFVYKCLSNPDSFTYVFPVIYTDMMPDVTDDESNAYMREKCLKENWMRSWAHLYHSIPLNTLHIFKPYLYKDKSEYAHEREWRMIYYDMENKDDFSLIPDLNCLKAIYYGPEISTENKEKLHEIAKNKEIAEYDVTFDLESRKYNLKVSPI